MMLIRVILALALSLVGQTLLARLFPGAAGFVDLTLLPVVWWGVAGGQRSAMLVGCASGLIHDAWFRIAVFGMGGFKRTLIGWLLGGLGGRFDLNHGLGRFAVTALVAFADGLLDLGLRAMLDLRQSAPALELIARSLCTALAAVLIFAFVDRFRQRDRYSGRLG
jgi:cell shape-determining protein MreD